MVEDFIEEEIRHLEHRLNVLSEASALLAEEGVELRTGLAATPFQASALEIEAVRSGLEARGVQVSLDEVKALSVLWTEDMPLIEREALVITGTAILTSMVIGALKSAVVYYARYKIFGDEFSCLGMTRAVVVGAATGALGPIALSLEVLGDLVDATLFAEFVIAVFDDALDLRFDLDVLFDSGLVAWIRIADEIVGDAIWASSGIRAPAVAFCSAVNSDALRRGELGGLRTWIDTELKPQLLDEFVPSFTAAQQQIEAELNSVGASSEDGLVAEGDLALEVASTTRDGALFTTGETLNWSLEVLVNQTGSYDFDIDLFRGGTNFGQVATRSGVAAANNQKFDFSGSLSTSTLFSQAGSTDGQHHFQVEVTNNSTGQTEWVQGPDSSASLWHFELRSDRKPSISMDIPLGVSIGVVAVELFVLDPDGVQPIEAALILDGSPIDLTPRLDDFAGDWRDGFSFNRNLGFSSAGIHTLRARVSDSQHTTYSGPERIVRVGGIPFLTLNPGNLTQVGVSAQYQARLQDEIGGIPDRQIFLESDRKGAFADSAGEAAASVQTAADGWASFRYTPKETGQHTITVFSEDASPNSLSSQSANVDAACAAPEAVRLQSPSDAKDDVGSSVELEWRTAEQAGSYDIHLGTSSPPAFWDSVPAEDSFDQEYLAGPLTTGEQYFWLIKARASCDPNLVSESDIRTFYTVGAPDPVTLTRPADGATDLPTSLVLDWENVTSPGGTLYDLYLGATSPPPFFEAMGTRTEKLVIGLPASTTHYWRVVAKATEQPSLTSTSPTWSFTTGEGSATTTTLSAVKDAGLRSGSPYGNWNYGGEVGGPVEERVFGCGNTQDIFQDIGEHPIRGALQFDLSSIPAGSTVQNATLTLQKCCEFGSQSGPLQIPMDPFTSAWAEQTITWNNRPGVDTGNRVDAVFPTSGTNPFQTDVTSLVTSWLDGSLTNHGMLISIPAWESQNGKAKIFYQREWNASGDRAATLAVTYAEPCLAPPAPATPLPSDGSSNQASPLTLDWEDVPGASAFNFYFGPTTPPPLDGLATESSAEVADLEESTTYYWQVEALADCDASVTSLSDVWSFTTKSCLPPAAPGLTSPADGAVNQPRQVSLAWNAAARADEYRVFLDTQNPPSALLGSTTATALLSQPLSAGTTYYWKVQTIRQCEGGLIAESEVRAFNTGLPPVADAGTDSSIRLDETASLGATPSASSGTPPYSYDWVVLNPSGATLNSASAANPVLTPSELGDYTCQLVVTDSLNFVSAPSQVTVTVEPACPESLVLSNDVLTGPLEFLASDTVTLGPNLVLDGSPIAIVAGSSIVFLEGTEVGGEFSADTRADVCAE